MTEQDFATLAALALMLISNWVRINKTTTTNEEK